MAQPKEIPMWGELQIHLATVWEPQAHPGAAALMNMPGEIMGNIFEYLLDDSSDALPNLLALEKTCRAFHKLFRNDEVWEICGRLCYPNVEGRANENASSREKVFHWRGVQHIRRWQGDGKRGTTNIVLNHLGGIGGIVNQILPLILSSYSSLPVANTSFVGLRSDAGESLAEVIQAHMVEKLEKTVLMVCEYHNPDEGYPEIQSKDLRLIDRLLYEGNMAGKFGELGAEDIQSLTDYCATNEALGADARFKMARALAYRAGIVKMSEEAFHLVASEVLHRMIGLMVDASISAAAQHDAWFDREPTDGSSIPADPAEVSRIHNTNHPVIIPRHINDAAVRCGMKPVTVCKFDESREVSSEDMGGAYEDVDDGSESSSTSSYEMEDASEVDEEEMEDASDDDEEEALGI